MPSLPPDRTPPLLTRIVLWLFLVGGLAGLSASLFDYYKESSRPPPASTGKAKVTRISETRDNFLPRNKGIKLLEYPVLEYVDERNVTRQLLGTGVLRGRVKVGDELAIGKIENSVVVAAAWFRSQKYLEPALNFGCLTGFAVLMFFIVRPRQASQP
jgi:hypothetical protein